MHRTYLTKKKGEKEEIEEWGGAIEREKGWGEERKEKKEKRRAEGGRIGKKGKGRDLLRRDWFLWDIIKAGGKKKKEKK